MVNRLPMISPIFSNSFKQDLEKLFIWRRDVRHFKPDSVPTELLHHLLTLANYAPSVGLSEPWQFICVESTLKKQQILELFNETNRKASENYKHQQREDYEKLKLSGLDDAPHHIAVFSEVNPAKGKGLGRHTMPQTAEYSTVMAIYSFWLAARAYGIGVGWVSILQPSKIKTILDISENWSFVAYLCVGYPKFEQDLPELETRGWEKRNKNRVKWIVV